jgi:pimeloyl-ACP methyl ester carboxylesterase
LEVQTVEVNGARLAYTETGSGPDTVFAHGILTDYRAWEAQIGPFSQENCVITYSRRHAQPNDNDEKPRDITIEKNAIDLEGLIQMTTSPPINLIGHSYGGFIAARLAATRPRLLEAERDFSIL